MARPLLVSSETPALRGDVCHQVLPSVVAHRTVLGAQEEALEWEGEKLNGVVLGDSVSSPPLLAFEELKMVHLELTDKCNARCPQCARNDCGGPVNPTLPQVEPFSSHVLGVTAVPSSPRPISQPGVDMP